MSECSVVARIRARPGMAGRVQQEMERLVGLTRSLDEGCIAYAVFQDREDANLFWFVETWGDEGLLEKHLASDHMRAYQKATGDLVEEVGIHRLAKIR
jgi:quinol monooxygenase YgiN